jgi:glycosyltransferase involved in cell wall biosynthesis
MINISVIIPVYNVEKYLIRCLDSIFIQQFSGTFEVIAIDDCSTDNSLKLLYDYQSNEKRLTIIKHLTNKKQSIARSTGMKAANGKYIMHVDSDDWILPNTFENLYKKCIETEADVLVFNFVRENSTGKRYLDNQMDEDYVTHDKLKVQKYFYGASVNKIVKKKLTEDLISGELGVNTTEDLLYSTEILLKSKKICVVSESYYVYFVNTDSITHLVGSINYIENQIIIISQIQKLLEKYKANHEISNNVLDYFEKWIFVELAKIHFLDLEKLDDCGIFIKNIFQNPIFSRARRKRLEKSLKSKYYCLYEVTKLFGIKLIIVIIVNSFKKGIKV